MTEQRALLERELLPAFAARLRPGSRVVNVGAGDHPYREHFTHCRYTTADRSAQVGCDDIFAAEVIPYNDASVDGVLFLSVLDRVDDPIQAMREIRRVLKPDGLLLFGTAGVGFAARKSCERWRLTPGGVAHVLQGLRTLETRSVGDVYYFVVARK